MKKHTGKVLSLVLALALVVSSLSTTFVSAATSSDTSKGTFTTDFKSGKTEVYLANSPDAVADYYQLPQSADIAATLADLGGTTITQTDNQPGEEAGKVIHDVTITNWTRSGNAATAPTRWDTVNDVAEDTATAPDAADVYRISPVAGQTGTVTYTATVTAKVDLNKNNKNVVYTSTATFTVYVKNAGEYVISANAAPDVGTAYTAIPSLPINGTTTAYVQKTSDNAAAKKPGTNCLLKYTAVTALSAKADVADGAGAATPVDTATSNDKVITGKTDGTGAFINVTATGLGTNAYLTVYDRTDTANVQTRIICVPEVTKTYQLDAATTANTKFNDTKTYVTDKNGKEYDISGYTVDTNGFKFTMTDGSIAAVTGTGSAEIDAGTVAGKVAVTGQVDIKGGTVGAITSGAAVNMTKGTVASIAATGAVAIDGGTVTGDVSSSAAAVTIGANIDKDYPVVINGSVKSSAVSATKLPAAAVVIIKAIAKAGTADADKALCTVTIKGNVSANYGTALVGAAAQDAAISVAGKVIAEDQTVANAKTTVGSVAPSPVLSFTLPKNNATILSTFTADNYNNTLADVTGFDAVTLSAGAGATPDKIATLAITNKLTAATVTVNTNAVLTTVNGALIETLLGPGSIKFPAGTLSVSAAVGANLKVIKLIPTGSYAKGSVIFTSIDGLVDANGAPVASTFAVDGMTLKTAAATGTAKYYTVDTLQLLRLDLPATTKVANGSTATLTANTYPTGAGLPSGSHIAWTSSDSNYVAVTGTGLSATVAGKNFSTVTNSPLNKVTVTATIVDANNVPVNGYSPATCTVEVTKTPDTLTLDKSDVTVLPGKTAVVTATSNVVVSATSADPSVATVAVSDKTITITGVAIGKTTINVVAGDVKATINVTVANTTLAFDKDAATVRAHTQSKIGYGDKNAYATSVLTVTGDTATLPTVSTSDATIATATVAKTATAGVYSVVVKGLKAGTVTVNASVGTVATTKAINVKVVAAAAGYLQIDTANKAMAPGAIYDIGCVVSGVPTTGAKALTVTTSRDAVAKVTKLANGNYRITAVKAGTAYVSFAIGNTHASVKIDVVAGGKGGTAVRATSFFD